MITTNFVIHDFTELLHYSVCLGSSCKKLDAITIINSYKDSCNKCIIFLCNKIQVS